MSALLQTGPIKTIPALRAILSSRNSCLTVHDLTALAAAIDLDRDALGDALRFDPDVFCYTTIFRSELFEVNCIGWRSGQQSEVHDHRGSACCVRVIEGVMTNVDYREAPAGRYVAAATQELTAGAILPRCDRQVHQLANRDPGGRDLVTLHLYSPPLLPLTERRCRTTS